jgi:hypothetical protein
MPMRELKKRNRRKETKSKKLYKELLIRILGEKTQKEVIE